jgi:hypothetical protein
LFKSFFIILVNHALCEVLPRLDDVVTPLPGQAHLLLQFGIPVFPAQCLSLRPVAGLDHIQMNYDEYNDDLNTYLRAWMNTVESGFIGRDDVLLNILHCLSEMTSCSRSKRELTSASHACSNERTDHFNGIPLVLTEEFDHDALFIPIEFLRRKFQWIPHFHNLPYVFGIAIN